MTVFKYVKAGDRLEIPSAEFRNAIVELLNQNPSFARGMYDRQSFASENYKGVRHPIYVRANDDIDEYSIFTITGADTYGSGSGSIVGTGTGVSAIDDMGFDWRYPKVFTKKVTDTNNCVLLVNKEFELGVDGDYFLDILGDEWPALVRYDPDDGIPTIGDEVGVKPNTYKVALGYTGLFVVSGPELYDEKVVWVVRSGGAGGGILPELCALEDAVRNVPYTALLGIYSPDTHSWCYDGASTVYAIDHRYGMPLAEAGWKGSYQKLPSNVYGVIYECISLDCKLPPEGCSCEYGTGS
jgi:hypothetical protein